MFGLDNIGIKHSSSLLHRGRGKEERRRFSGVFTDRLTLGVCSCKIAYTKYHKVIWLFVGNKHPCEQRDDTVRACISSQKETYPPVLAKKRAPH